LDYQSNVAQRIHHIKNQVRVHYVKTHLQTLLNSPFKIITQQMLINLPEFSIKRAGC